MPSGWHAQSSNILATCLYSGSWIGRLTIVLMRGLKISALMNHSERASYISLSLNSRTMSITYPIKSYTYFFSDKNAGYSSTKTFRNGLTKNDKHSTKHLECTKFTKSGFLNI